VGTSEKAEDILFPNFVQTGCRAQVSITTDPKDPSAGVKPLERDVNHISPFGAEFKVHDLRLQFPGVGFN
jgi:hypothetical protein